MSDGQKARGLQHYSALSECIWQCTVRVRALKHESVASWVHRAGGLGRHPELTFKPSGARSWEAFIFLVIGLSDISRDGVALLIDGVRFVEREGSTHRRRQDHSLWVHGVWAARLALNKY